MDGARIELATSALRTAPERSQRSRRLRRLAAVFGASGRAHEHACLLGFRIVVHPGFHNLSTIDRRKSFIENPALYP